MESRPLSKTAYRRQLEKKKTKELIEILVKNGKNPAINSDRTRIIDQILNLPDNFPENEGPKKTYRRVNKSAVKYAVNRFIFTCIIIIFAQAIVFFFQFLYLFRFQKLIYCDSNLKNTDCIRCPANSVCHVYKKKCKENFISLDGLCLPNRSDSKQLSQLIYKAKDKLRERAGFYKCQESRIDWMSQDELENLLIKILKLKTITRSHFDVLFNLTIEYLKNETDIITKDIDGSTVFVAIDFKTPTICSVKSIFYRNFILFSIAFVVNIYIYYFKRRSPYEIQADQCMLTVINFIRSFNRNEVSQSEVKNIIKPMFENPDAVWKYVKKKLKKSPSIGWKKDEGEIYFYSYE